MKLMAVNICDAKNIRKVFGISLNPNILLDDENLSIYLWCVNIN